MLSEAERSRSISTASSKRHSDQREESRVLTFDSNFQTHSNEAVEMLQLRLRLRSA